jgi:hypothetical protein
MGDVIEFKPKPLNIKVTLEEVDSQLLLECAIVEMWHQLGGDTIEDESFLYHVWFLQFSDICFSSMETGAFTVDEDGIIGVDKLLLDSLTEAINEFKRKAATNDNTPDRSD